MARDTLLMCGIILLTVPTIQYGGFFLLRLLGGAYARLELTPFQRSMFRAGHAHAGVLVLLALICQPLVEHASLGIGVAWAVRVAFPLAAVLISGGFFAAAAGRGRTSSGPGIWLLYAGIGVLASALIALGIALVIPA